MDLCGWCNDLGQVEPGTAAGGWHGQDVIGRGGACCYSTCGFDAHAAAHWLWRLVL